MVYQIIISACFLFLSSFLPRSSQDYLEYHGQINQAEILVSKEAYSEALSVYEEIFEEYDFVFLRDYKVAAQLALITNDKPKAFKIIERGLANGWQLKYVKKNDFLKPLANDPEWITLEETYPDLHAQFEKRIDVKLRNQVHQMSKKDQKMALGALFRIGNKAQEKYGTEKFGPHSNQQMLELIDITNTKGYPGEKLIANNYWVSTIISHHNSASVPFVKQDTLYDFMRPMFLSAIKDGEMSPYEYALSEDWRIAVLSDREAIGYGYVVSPKKYNLNEVNDLRTEIGLRSVELRNELVDIENKTGMNFYLPDWVKGKIVIEE